MMIADRGKLIKIGRRFYPHITDVFPCIPLVMMLSSNFRNHNFAKVALKLTTNNACNVKRGAQAQISAIRPKPLQTA